MRPANRRFLFALVAFGLAGTGVAPAQKQDKPKDYRHEFFDAQLVIETGSRTAACDMLQFTDDGKYLLAAGDDKVVRAWKWDGERLHRDDQRTLRWSIFREARGNIYAFALDRSNRHLAVGGFGLRSGAAAVIDRENGKIVHASVQPPVGHFATIWSVAFSSSGRQVAYGADDGGVWLWDLDAPREKALRQLGRHTDGDNPKRFPNRVRLVAFTSDTELISASEDGSVLRWTLTNAGATSREEFRFTKAANVVAAALSPKQAWIAAAGEVRRKGETARFIELRSLKGGATKFLELPEGTHYPKCLAFDARGETLAVGVYTIAPGARFYNLQGGYVVRYDLRAASPRPDSGPRSTYYPEALAFHPRDSKYLAVAGGNNHEVVVWDLSARPAKQVSEVSGPGQCLWDVGLSKDGAAVGFRTKRNPAPGELNRWGQGRWDVFDLRQRTLALGRDFDPVMPLEKGEGGWTVEPDAADGYVWYVTGPGGQRHRLPLEKEDHMPRCYTFLRPEKGKPVRLAVGHYWGVSVFALDSGGPRLARKFVGHQGEVMAVAPSAGQVLLVTASRDQTVAAWSLADWPAQAELGAAFALPQGKLTVVEVNPGSPAWEAGLSSRDEVLSVQVFSARGEPLFLHDPQNRVKPELRKHFETAKVIGDAAQAIAQLNRPVPGRRYEFEYRPRGEGDPRSVMTTVRQRPLWRLFPTRDGDWVLWRWRDYYYDTSLRGDSLIGWQVSGEPGQTPEYHRAEQFRQAFHKPALVSHDTLQKLALLRENVDQVVFPDIQPPGVVLRTAAGVVRDKDKTLTANLEASARGDRANQELERVILWVNDYQFQTWVPEKDKQQKRTSFRLDVNIPLDKLRRGENVLTLQCYNKAGARGESAAVRVRYNAPPPAAPRVHGLFVGVGNYFKANPPQRQLRAHKDAEAMYEAWKNNKLYKPGDLQLLVEEKAAPAEVLKQLRALGQPGQVKPDDLFVLFLGGHGISEAEIGRLLREGKAIPRDRLRPGAFAFCGSRFDMLSPNESGLTSHDLYEALVKLSCHKLVLLDACHSGTVGVNPIRELTRDGVGPVILAACRPDESAFEHPTLGLGRAYGLFTLAIMTAVEDDFSSVAGRNAPKDQLDAAELEAYVRSKVGGLLAELRQIGRATAKDVQTPEAFLPPLERRLPLEERK